MTFAEMLNRYIESADCTARELAEASGLSAAVISRYRAGVRTPAADSDSLARLADGIAALSGEPADSVLAALTDTLRSSDFDYERFAENFNALIDAVGLNVNRLARYLNFDASFISRIRAGRRRPAEPKSFAEGVCRFVASSVDDIGDIAALIGRPAAELADPHVLNIALYDWLVNQKGEKTDSVDRFLNKLDDFDLNDYIRSIKFDELKVPSVPFQIPTSKSYIGVEQLCAGELDFLKATVLSYSTEPVFMCSDMDMNDMASDVEFAKKWMFGVALCLKKGLHLNVIHTVDRPFDEMMLGLEGWMPIYMTGQISPYYLKNARSTVYGHLNYVSGAAALTGECISGHHDRARYYLTKKSEDIAYYREKSEFILKKALPLMDIYRAERRQEFTDFLDADSAEPGKRHEILSVPPVYTLPPELLGRILRHCDLSDDEQTEIEKYVADARERIERVLQSSELLIELPRVTPEEFDEYPCYLALDGMFCGKDIAYNYDEYSEHLEATREFARTHAGCSVRLNLRRSLRRVQIVVHEGEFALVSKGKAPAIHFVVRHEKLRDAIRNIVLPVADGV